MRTMISEEPPAPEQVEDALNRAARRERLEQRMRARPFRSPLESISYHQANFEAEKRRRIETNLL
jgi:hypothetical protein